MAYNKEKNELIWNNFLNQPPVDERFISKQMDIAAQIDTCLKQNGWTQKKLAEKAGIRPGQLSRIMAGDGNPTLRTITNIEEALGMEIIVCPEFYEEELKDKGWSHPGSFIGLSTGSYRSTTISGNLVATRTVGWQVVDIPKIKQFSTADDYHLKPTGT